MIARNKQTIPSSRSNKDIALELVKAMLEGGALDATRAGDEWKDKSLQSKARLDASYVANLYFFTLQRLEKADEPKSGVTAP